jgi:hypothetical protein
MMCRLLFAALLHADDSASATSAARASAFHSVDTRES